MKTILSAHSKEVLRVENECNKLPETGKRLKRIANGKCPGRKVGSGFLCVAKKVIFEMVVSGKPTNK